MTCVNPVRASMLAITVLLWAVSPAIACLMPGHGLTAPEQECCHHMAEQCSQTAMPTSHSCCQIPSGPPDAVVQASASLPIRNAVVVALVTHAITALPTRNSEVSAEHWYSPPLDPGCSSISILRI